MTNTEKFGVISLGGIRSTEKWGTVRENSSEGDAWTLLQHSAPDLPYQEGAR